MLRRRNEWFPPGRRIGRGRDFLQITQRGNDGRFEALFFCDEGPADAVVFDVVPDEFIGVELGAVRRQE